MTRRKVWSPHGLHAVILFIFFMLMDCTRAKQAASHDRNGATSLKCLLRSVSSQSCRNVAGYMLPNRFFQMYENMNEETKDSITSQKLDKLSPENFAKLPVQLFLLIPSRHLHLISGSLLATLLESNNEDVPLTLKIMGALNPAKFGDFFSKLEGVRLASRVQDKITETLVKWFPDVNTSWTFGRFNMIARVGDPLIAHFPPYFLANLSNSEASRFLFHFRNWLWTYLPENLWDNKSESAKRTWCDLMLHTSYPVNVTKWTENEGRRFRFLLEGATPDELKLLTLDALQSSKLFKRKLSKIQVRTLFRILYPHGELTSDNLSESELLSVALQLSPVNLQKFNLTSTDLNVLFNLQYEGYSYSTALQIVEFQIARSVLLKKLKSWKPKTWDSGIEYIGKFAFVLPPSALESYGESPPSLIAQSRVDSYKLTSRQARLLTGGIFVDLDKPDVLLGQRGLLRALPSSLLASATTLPQSVLSHILQHLPPDLPMQAAALLLKVGKLTGKNWALKSILSNKQPSQFFELMSSRTIASLGEDIKSIKEFGNVIKTLQQKTLSVLLTSERTKLAGDNILWSSENLLSKDNKNILLGLSCNDIYAMETVDFIYVMNQYNKQRKSEGKTFPKNLQYCSQMALMNYLEMKASLQNDMTLVQLLDYLEPADIEAVGGYIFGSLPTEDIEKSIRRKDILEAIGQLSLPELLVSTKEANPTIYAQLLLNQYVPSNHSFTINSKELFGLGNFFHFLSSVHLSSINPVSFKLYLESLGDSKSKTICANEASRSALFQVIHKSFGEPFKWSPGVLSALGDMLIVVPSKHLNVIPLDSWRDAADTLIDATSYHLKLEWPGKSEEISFYQACAETLNGSEAMSYKSAVHELARWYLAAVQNQLNTVVNASQLISLTHQAIKGRGEKTIKDVPLEIVQHETHIKVLETETEKQVISEMTMKNSTDVQVAQKSPIDSSWKEETTTEYFSTTILITNSSSSTNIPETVETDSSSVPGVSSLESSSDFKTYIVSVFSTSDDKLNVSLASVLDETEFISPFANTEIITSSPLESVTTTFNMTKEEQSTNSHGDFEDFKIKLHESNTISTTNEHNSEQDSLVSESEISVVQTDAPSDSPDRIFITVAINSSEKYSELTSEPFKYNIEYTGDSVYGITEAYSVFNNTIIQSSNNSQDEVPDLSKFNLKITKSKRHANLGELTESTQENTDVDHLGDMLRGILKTDKGVPHTNVPSPSTTKPEVKEKFAKSKARQSTWPWQKVSCHAIRAAGPSVYLAIDETDIELMGSKELEDCIDALGSLELDNSMQNKIWSSVNKDKFLHNLSDLGYLVTGLNIEDVPNINLNLSMPYALDNLAIMSRMITDAHMLHELGVHFTKSNPHMKVLTTEVIIALGRILCDVIAVSSQKLHDLIQPTVFLQASPVLGKMKTCPTHCLHKLAHLATKSSEYGSLNVWTAEDVTTLGIIPAGLKAEQWKQLTSTGYGNNPLVGLQPSAVKYIPPQIFKELNEDQLKSLPTLSSSIVSEEQFSHLSESQQIALARVQREVPVLKHSTNENVDVYQNETSKCSTTESSIYLLVIFALTVMCKFSVH